MKKNLVFLALMVFLTAPLTALAGGARITVRVDGLSCPFCAYGIEKKIKKIEGVEDIRVDIKSGNVIVLYKDKKFFEREGLNKAVKDAGFTPREITVDDLKE